MALRSPSIPMASAIRRGDSNRALTSSASRPASITPRWTPAATASARRRLGRTHLGCGGKEPGQPQPEQVEPEALHPKLLRRVQLVQKRRPVDDCHQRIEPRHITERST